MPAPTVTTAYKVSRHGDGYRVDDDADPPRRVALIERKLDRKGGLLGWRFKPVTIMRGPHSKTWRTPDAALVGFGLMTPARARNAIAAASTPPAPPLPA